VSAIRAVWKNGQIVPDAPVDWPEGTVLRIVPATDLGPNGEALEDPPGTTGDAQSDEPEVVARWVAEFEAIPPLPLAPAEEAAWQADRRRRRESELATFNERADKLRRLFE
jgi:hypothetical protein